MTAEIVRLPSSELELRLASLAAATTDELIEIVIEAYNKDLRRAPIRKALQAGRFGAGVKRESIQRLFEWADNKRFVGKPPRPRVPVKANPASPPQPEDPWPSDIARVAYETADADFRFQDAFEAWREQQTYKAFPPAWEHDTAEWRSTFGEADPVPVIDFYLSRFFESSDPGDFHDIAFTNDDVSIWRNIVDRLASHFESRFGPSVGELRKILRSLLGLPSAVGASLSPLDRKLPTLIGKVERSLASRLVEWWLRADVACELRNNRPVPNLQPMLELTYPALIKRLTNWQIADEAEFEAEWDVPRSTVAEAVNLEPISERFDERAIEALFDMEEETSGFSHPLTYNVTRAVYRARCTLFGNVFPFDRHSLFALHLLQGERGYWLADFSGSPSMWPHYVKYFSVLGHEPAVETDSPWLSERTVGGTRRRVTRVAAARRRFEAYEGALEDILRDGYVELARAWWSFFIASQAQTFGGTGLGSKETRRVIQIADELGSDERIGRALTFLRLSSEEYDSDLDRRLITDLVPKSPSGANVLRLVAEGGSNADYLRGKMGEDPWLWLSPESQRDLEEAEALWSRAYREAGAGRGDWGSMALMYCRVIEVEMKRSTIPLLRELHSLKLTDVSPSKSVTLGSIDRALRQAKKSLSAKIQDAAFAHLRETVDQLFSALALDRFELSAVRNKAAHADRAQPVDVIELLNLRSVVLERGLFAVLKVLQGDA